MRGRVFALYDAVFQMPADVFAIAVAALLGPADGRAPWLVAATAGVYVLGMLAHDRQLRGAPPTCSGSGVRCVECTERRFRFTRLGAATSPRARVGVTPRRARGPPPQLRHRGLGGQRAALEPQPSMCHASPTSGPGAMPSSSMIALPSRSGPDPRRGPPARAAPRSAARASRRCAAAPRPASGCGSWSPSAPACAAGSSGPGVGDVPAHRRVGPLARRRSRGSAGAGTSSRDDRLDDVLGVPQRGQPLAHQLGADHLVVVEGDPAARLRAGGCAGLPMSCSSAASRSTRSRARSALQRDRLLQHGQRVRVDVLVLVVLVDLHPQRGQLGQHDVGQPGVDEQLQRRAAGGGRSSVLDSSRCTRSAVIRASSRRPARSSPRPPRRPASARAGRRTGPRAASAAGRRRRSPRPSRACAAAAASRSPRPPNGSVTVRSGPHARPPWR